MRHWKLLLGVWACVSANAAEPKVQYREGKAVDFEQLLIQGELKRPEISVVTGDHEQSLDGLLRLRENFIDRIAQDAGASGELTP